MNHSTGTASLFLSHAGRSNVTFRCAQDTMVGAYSLQEGEPIKAVSDGQGLFYVSVEWGEGAIGRLNAHDVNKLAGYEAVGE